MKEFGRLDICWRKVEGRFISSLFSPLKLGEILLCLNINWEEIIFSF
jgi:hypothetical protein